MGYLNKELSFFPYEDFREFSRVFFYTYSLILLFGGIRSMKKIVFSIVFLILGILLVFQEAPLDLYGLISMFCSIFLLFYGIHQIEKNPKHKNIK